MSEANKRLEHFFKCPSCDIEFSKNKHAYLSDLALFDCNSCNSVYISIDCFYFFNEPIDKGIDDFEKIIKEKYESFQKSSENYEAFLAEKEKREITDLYAAFQPFNESTKAFYPFINILNHSLEDDDIILDTWCRTGYSAAFLASTFPKQHIVSIWEGDNNVLGYSGFHYWFKGNTDNISIIFTSLNEKLAIRDKTVSFIHGLDTLHRYDMDIMLKEFLRICKKDAPIIFPHIHLSNSEPEPFFERGCLQIHGNDYKAYFEKVLKGSHYEFSILSEPELFLLYSETELKSDPNMKDYNALACIHNPDLGTKLRPFTPNLELKSNFILNPIIDINFNEMLISLKKEKWNNEVQFMLDRHPVYEDYLSKFLPFELTSFTAQILFLITQGLSLDEIKNELNFPLEKITKEIMLLWDKNIIEILNCSKKLSRMQQSFSSKKLFISPQDHTLEKLWESAVKRSADSVLFHVEDEEISYSESNEIVLLLASTLLAKGLKKGDVVIYYGPYDYQVFLLIWSCALTGIIFTPLSQDTPYEQFKSIVKDLNAKLIFTDYGLFESLVDYREKLIVINDDENETELSVYEHMVEDIDLDNRDNIYPEDIAVILFSSGTTGKAKGIPLSQSALFRSSQSFAKFYEIIEDDRIFSLGDVSTMSGLRNPAFIPLHVNASIICPQAADLKSFVKIAEIIKLKNASILTTTPSSISTFHKFKDHFSFPKSLTKILCTGSRLPQVLAEQFYENFKIPIYNYYGLTESCGFILASSIESHLNPSIGIPVDCIAEIVDESANKVTDKKIGYLRVYSRNLAKQYLISKEDIHIKDHWFYTGDYAFWDDNSNVNLAGRVDDAFKDRKGNLIYTEEIEHCIENHPKIIEVAVKKMKGDEDSELVAFLVHHHNDINILSNEIKELVINKLGESKCPHRFIEKNELPRGVNGKILKNKLV